MFRSTMDVPTRYQWDPDSRLPSPDPGTAPGNCGITCATVAEQFYTDTWHGIYANRRLVTSSLELSSTIGQQSQILWKRGVPNVIDKINIAGLHQLLQSRRRPIVIGMDFSKVPYDIAGHPFRGSHSILLRANATGGFIDLDPNFNRTYRQDPDHGYRFMPDWVVQAAYYNVPTQWAIIPTKDKLVPDLVPRARITQIGTRIYQLDVLGDNGKLAGNWFATAQRDGIRRMRDKVVIVDRWDRAFKFHGMQHGARHGIGAHPERWGVLTINGVKRAVPGPQLNVL